MTTSPETNQQTAIEEALKVCASEPIHLIGSIQPAGILLAIDRETFAVRAASQNLQSIFPLTASEAIGKALADLIDVEQLGWLHALMEAAPWDGAKVWSVTLPSGGQLLTHDAQVFLAGDLFVIEIEQWQAPSGDVFHNLFIPIRDALWKLDSETDLDRYAQMAVDQVRVLTGFDRVMMYRFDTNWDGEVIAESKTEEADSYLGNRFPASDIPPQARELYTRNLVRVIADVNAEPVPLISAPGQAPGQGIDLSHSWLRSMSPVHVEYLRNMGVCASLSISLVQNDRLWGLIACHHFSPRYVGLRSRELDEFIGRVVSLKLINMDTIERDTLSLRIRDLLYELTSLIRASDDLDSVIVLLKEKLLGLVRSVGAVVTIDGTRHLLGNVPSAPVLDHLVDLLKTRPVAPVFYTDDLGQLVEGMGFEVGDTASGVLVAPLDHQLNNFVIWFRPGILRTLRWAGNPQKALVHDASGVRLSPRTSFDTWIQTYHDKSLPWSQVEIDAANSLSLALIELLAQKALRNSEESYRLLAENSTDMIARLKLDGTFRFASPACRDLFGRESAQLTGFNLLDVVDEAPEVIVALLQSLQPLGAMTTKVMRGKRQSGLDLWVEATLKHTLGAHGENEILLNARDVTQRYNYQLAIEDVHRRHTQILEAAGEGLVSVDTRGYVVYANEIAAKILGHDEEELVGQDCCHVFYWETRTGYGTETGSSFVCPFIATLQDGETRQGTKRVDCGEGRPSLLLQYVCTPLADNDRVAGCVIMFSEISQKATSGQNVPTEVILDEAAEAVMVTDHAGRITSINRAFTEITGYTTAEALGQSPRLLKSGVHTPHFYAELWRFLSEKKRWAGEIWNRRKNGEIYPQWGSISAVLDNAGNVQNYVSVFSDISKAKQAEERLFHLANHDPLTCLPNRMNFTENLGQVIQRCKRQNYGAAIVFIDLDRFKIINDTLGHAVGDKYLKIISERLLATTRKQDLLARWGGDEFVLVMEAFDDIHAIGEAMTRMLENLAEPLHLAGHELIPTASIGVAIYPADGRRSTDLIKAADTAMYGAKQRGRNCYELYSKDMGKDLNNKLLMTSELRHALHEQQFFLVYQPQVDPRDGRIKGVEALVRWRHPQRGVLPPAQFLSLVEEMGMIGELGHWVLNEACRQMKVWVDSRLPIAKVSVNVAPAQLKDSFVGDVDSVLRKWHLEPSRLELEITEGALESGELARRITEALRALGVMLAVDDFGTGYSSLSHIKLFPITCFKIDKSFVDGVPGNTADVAIVRAILALGSSFNVEIVAEGVESIEQMEFLKAEGVTNIQGYFFAHPMLPEELELAYGRETWRNMVGQDTGRAALP